MKKYRVPLFLIIWVSMGFSQEPPLIFPPPGDKSFGEEEQIRERVRWFRSSRKLDEVSRPGLLRKQAILRTKAMIAAQASRDGAVWQLKGPAPMTMFNWAMGNVAGRVSALAYDPTDPDIMYLGTASGGLWKTLDGGRNWVAVFNSVGTQTIGAVFVEPGAPQNVWVGTGEQGNSCTGYFGMGLFKSSDGGATFVEKNGSIANPLSISYLTGIAVHPSNADIVLAGGQYWCEDGSLQTGGLYRSTDGGDNWTQVLAGSINDILIDPSQGDVAYASMGRGSLTQNGVYKSTDAGVTWNRLENGLPSGSAVTRTRLAMAHSDPQTLYALMRFSGTRLYKTTDGGANWTLQNSNACDGQCSYNLCVDINPTDPTKIMVGTVRPHSSSNSGTTLTAMTAGWGPAQTVHQDIHVVKYHRGADGNTFWIGSDGGLWKTVDGGNSYENLNDGLNITQFYDVAVHPNNSDIIFGGAQDNSSSRGIGDLLWDTTEVTGDGFMNLVDPSNPDIVFQTSYPSGGFPNILRSTTGGAPNSFNWITTSGMVGGDPWPWVVQMGIADLDGSNPTQIFVVSSRVYRSAVDPIAWEDISGVLGANVAASIVSPVVANGKMALYIGKQNGTIYRTDDAMASAGSVQWTDVTGNFPADWVSGIAPDPTNPLRVFATRSAFGGSKIYRSTAGGGTWEPVGAGLPDVPANDVVVDPLDLDRIFVAMDTGVFMSTDGGENFVPMMDGLPLGSVVTDLEIDDLPYILTAGTYGRGAWQIELTVDALVVDPGTDRLVCAGGSSALSAGAGGGLPPYTYAWSVASGPDTSSSQFDDPASPSPVFTPSTTGTYLIECQLTDSRQTTIMESVNIYVYDATLFMAALLESWTKTQNEIGWLADLDRNGNGNLDILDVIIELDSPFCQ